MDDRLYCNILATVIHALEEKTLKKIDDNDGRIENRRHKGSYEYIPYNTRCFVEVLNTIKKDYEERYARSFASVFPKFIDAGCGLGVKLVLAAAMGFQTTGLEIDCELIERAEDIFALDHDFWFGSPHQIPGIINQDVLDHDYQAYDVIYFYCPFVNRDKEEAFEKRVHSQMKQGAYLVAVGRVVKPPEEQFEGIKAHTTIYRRK